MQNLKKHKKEKKTLFVSTPVLTALVKMSFFCAFFIFGFFAISVFFDDVFDCFPKIKKYKQKKQSKQNQKQEEKEDKGCKAKTNEIL